MDMQIWSGCELQGEVIPLKRNFITSIHELVRCINQLRSDEKTISKLKLDNNFIVQLNFSFLTIPCETGDDVTDSIDDDPQGKLQRIPSIYKEQIMKVIDSIEMLIRDEVVAARRKQRNCIFYINPFWERVRIPTWYYFFLYFIK